MKRQKERGRSRKRKERDSKAKIRLVSAAVCITGLFFLAVLYLQMRQQENREINSGTGEIKANDIQTGGELPSNQTVYYGYQWALHNDGLVCADLSESEELVTKWKSGLSIVARGFRRIRIQEDSEDSCRLNIDKKHGLIFDIGI